MEAGKATGPATPTPEGTGAFSPKADSRTKSLPQPKLRKAESLNPRLIKSSPATHEVRYKLLRMLYQEFARLNGEMKKDAIAEEASLVMSDQDLILQALDEEERTAVEKPSIYPNVIKNRIMQYKRMTVLQWKEERVNERKKAAPRNQDKQPLGPPKEIRTGLTPSQEAQLLSRLITPITNLSEHGYVPAVPKPEDVEKARQGQEAAQGWEKCDRCTKRFQVFPGRREEDGALASGGSCIYHWGKMYHPDQVRGEVVQAIRSVSQGRSFLTRKVSQILQEDYISRLRQRGLEDRYDLLSDREREILQMIAEGRSNKEVATNLM